VLLFEIVMNETKIPDKVQNKEQDKVRSQVICGPKSARHFQPPDHR
jgi:hypothetical protein